MPELLLELLSEEIPASLQEPARLNLRQLLIRCFHERLHFENPRYFVTPRRLTAVIELPAKERANFERRFGPRKGAPEASIQGFLRSLPKGTRDPEWRVERGVEKLFVEVEHPGRDTRDALAEEIPALLARFPWPKSMRWGDHEIRWIRPLRSILCLFDGEVVPVEFGPLRAGAATQGHRFLAPAPIEVRDFQDYCQKLAAAYVQLDGAERQRAIKTAAERLARDENLRLREDPALLAELAGLVEWPVGLLGRIDERFMALPEEVLVTAMRHHQKYLALEDAGGGLAPRFVVIANLPAKDGGRAIVAGNERVLRARLWDAQFFWDKDRKRPLASRVPELDGVVFHARLGSLGAKATRLEQLAGWIAQRVAGATPELAVRASLLAKADLVTGMVGEFPELQGIMGRHYALHDGEPPEVAAAIADHYAPQGPSDMCPSAPVSVAVSLADKLDTLAGFCAIAEKPTGSKDPFGLRRAALGAIRLILENELRLSLRDAFKQALAGYGDVCNGTDADEVSRELLGFFADRLKVHLRDSGVRHDLISAVFAAGEEDDLVRLLARVEALRAFLATEDGANLLVALRRASNIVRIEEKRDRRSYAGQPDDQRLEAKEERILYARLMTVGGDVTGALAREDFGDAMAALARLRQPVDAFFDRVTVNAEDPQLRENRLYLLGQIRAALGTLADFSLIQDTVQAEQDDRRVA
jgi:glycyl-tRNA synthetase beta chain